VSTPIFHLRSNETAMAKTFNDPLFASQWYLVNTGQRGGTSRLDINVLSAWDKYTGKGIVVAVNDDGMDLTHPALSANLLTNLTYDAGRDTVGQGFVGAANSHGTVVGSIVGMAGNDGIGGVGVAFDSKIVAGLTAGDNAKVFLANLSAGAAVSVNSWGFDPSFSENFGSSGSQLNQAWGAALLRCATEARNGLGMVIEVSGGNERGNNADVAMTNFTGSRLTIAVGAITETGTPASYSSQGASLLVCAPGGVGATDNSSDTGFGIPSADVQGTGGYNTVAGTAGDYTYQNQGTSYSGPMVGGAAALMLQANPKLGFRDVSTILALTARQVDTTNTSWVRTAASDWNLGGMHFSRDFGYGLVDVSAAVRLAESWNLTAGTIANWQSVEGAYSTTSGSIPDNSPSGFTAVATVANSVRIERVEFDLNLTATNPSQLSATITSPGGTTVTLFDQPLTRTLANGAPDMTVAESAWPSTFTIGSTAFLGESSAGNWTLKLTDKVTGIEATFNSVTVRAWGSATTSNSQYIFTDEFATKSSILTDTSGVDTLNAAAASNVAQLDLRAGNLSKVGSGEFTISTGSLIENAIGGLGSDFFTGNDARNVFRGNGGNDTIDGGAGIDTAAYTGARSGYTVVKGTSGWTVSSTDEGADSLLNVERLQFSDATFALDISGNAGQVYRIYQAAFNRAADAGGLGYWISVMDSGATLNNIAQGFVDSPEFKKLYGTNPTNEQVMSKMYDNVLHRTPDQAGYDYWVGVLNRNEASVAAVLATISESPENQAALVGVIGNGFVFTPYVG
jgi:subtilisin-like proprotein convertase family protein